MITVIIILFSVLLLLIRLYFKKKYMYWINRNIHQFEPSIPFGNTNNSLKNYNFGVTIADFYKRMKAKGWQDGGLYRLVRPIYLPIDLEFIKHILTKDFNHFTDRGTFSNPEEPLTNHLFAIGGTKWRNLRTKLTPTFTSGKLKGMFPIFLECSERLCQAIPINESVNIKEVLGRFTTDVIGSCAFGLDCESFSAEDSQFRVKAAKFFTFSPMRRFYRQFVITFPEFAKKIGLKHIPADISNFYMDVVKSTESFRRTNNIRRNDFFQLLIDLMEDNQLTMNEVAAQAFVFFLAGFETSSTTMTFALYELAKHQDIQQRVREEIETVLKKNNKQISYESLKEMTYLQQVIDETLRKYPPASIISRQAISNYEHPLKNNFVIEKGTMVFIPILGIHYDDEFYPDPQRFDPDRFNEDNKRKRHQYAYLPFGEGPRICIGLRFGLLQVKVGLAALLQKYQFEVSAKTQEPIKFTNKSFVLAAEGDIWLKISKI